MTFKDFKKQNPGGYSTIAAADIPGGFAKKGHSLYGNCDDMEVIAWVYHPERGGYTVYLAEASKSI